jgi:membrane fusion protein (multidrug efflux system)
MYHRKYKLCLTSALGLGLVALAGCGKETSAPVAAAPEVPVIKVQKQDLSIPIEFVGQTKGAVDAEIRARVEGVILGVHFAEGKEVKEGDLLYTIDPAPFEAKVAKPKPKYRS